MALRSVLDSFDSVVLIGITNCGLPKVRSDQPTQMTIQFQMKRGQLKQLNDFYQHSKKTKPTRELSNRLPMVNNNIGSCDESDITDGVLQ